jgi:hypothetical protein
MRLATRFVKTPVLHDIAAQDGLVLLKQAHQILSG